MSLVKTAICQLILNPNKSYTKKRGRSGKPMLAYEGIICMKYDEYSKEFLFSLFLVEIHVPCGEILSMEIIVFEGQRITHTQAQAHRRCCWQWLRPSGRTTAMDVKLNSKYIYSISFCWIWRSLSLSLSLFLSFTLAQAISLSLSTLSIYTTCSLHGDYGLFSLGCCCYWVLWGVFWQSAIPTYMQMHMWQTVCTRIRHVICCEITFDEKNISRFWIFSNNFFHL